jgi:DNA-binding transcriptional ArsR family regulator
MARSKKHLYSPAELSICELMKVIDHPARPRILRQLLEQGTTCVTNLAPNHPISRESLSGHLNKLYDHNLLLYYEQFPYSFYSVHQENLSNTLHQLIRWCHEYLRLLEKSNHHPRKR